MKTLMFALAAALPLFASAEPSTVSQDALEDIKQISSMLEKRRLEREAEDRYNSARNVTRGEFDALKRQMDAFHGVECVLVNFTRREMTNDNFRVAVLDKLRKAIAKSQVVWMENRRKYPQSPNASANSTTNAPTLLRK